MCKLIINWVFLGIWFLIPRRESFMKKRKGSLKGGEMLGVIITFAIAVIFIFPRLLERPGETRSDNMERLELKQVARAVAGAIESYRDKVGEEGPLPTGLFADDPCNPHNLGFKSGELTGEYFQPGHVSFKVLSMKPLEYRVFVERPDRNPTKYILDEEGGIIVTEKIPGGVYGESEVNVPIPAFSELSQESVW